MKLVVRLHRFVPIFIVIVNLQKKSIHGTTMDKYIDKIFEIYIFFHIENTPSSFIYPIKRMITPMLMYACTHMVEYIQRFLLEYIILECPIHSNKYKINQSGLGENFSDL